MDNITHGLMGAAIGMLRKRDGGFEHDGPLSDTDKAVAWASFLAAEAPDIDVFFSLFARGAMDEYKYHRGITHSFLMAPVIALVATGLTKLVWRGAKARTVYGWSLAAVLVAHLVNDWMTGWGTRLLFPFSDVRLGLDWVPIVDLLYTLPLLAAVILAWRRPRARRQAAAAILSYLALYTFGYRAVTHSLVERAVTAAYTGRPVAQLRISPDMINPLAWQFTVDLGDRYEQGQAYPFARIQADRVAVKGPDDPVTRALKSSAELKPFFDQFQFVQIKYQKTPGGYQAQMGDVRYQWGGGSGMSYTILLNETLQITAVKGGGRE